jgi:hypothetical protein
MEERKRILLVQLFSNGDCLYATAVARQIKQDFPGCHLTWAIAGFCKNIIDNNPYVDEIRVTDEVSKNDVAAFRKFKKKIRKEKKDGQWDEVFITHNMDKNQALYDGTIRGMIFRAYPKPITVPVQPILILTEQEKQNVKRFAEEKKLSTFKNIILWEFAPQSGQSVLNFDFVLETAKRITEIPDTCVILSSAQSFASTEKIFDASVLSVRENAALTHYCHLLIGCSSGITWINTSTAAKQLPMLQLLDPNAFFLNAPSVDFKRYGVSTSGLIELTQFDGKKIYACVRAILTDGFETARQKFNEELPIQFYTTRKIVYNLLCYLQFKSIVKHYRIITSVYGRQREFLKQFYLAILTFPFRLVRNVWRKRVASKF